MQIVRTIIWVLILFAILAFSFFNWRPVEVTLWDNMVLETKVPALVIIAFLLGLVPMWLYHRSVKWTQQRRIRSLEASVKSAALAHRHDPGTAEEMESMPTAPVHKPADNPAQPEDNTALAPATASEESTSSAPPKDEDSRS